MAIPDKYQAADSWPHSFAKGETKLNDSNDGLITRMYCTHCNVTYWYGLESRPTGKCPARNDKQEYRRILGQ